MSRINDTQTLRSLRYMRSSRQAEARSTQKLASGQRIVKASDDAAGLAISEKVKAKTRSQSQAMRNANDAISIVQTIEGGLHEMNAMIIRIRELSVYAASDTVSGAERLLMNKESSELLREIDRQAKVQEMFGHKLGLGEKKFLDIQVDANGGSADRIKMDLGELSHTTYALGIMDVAIDSKLHANTSMYKLDYALKEIGKSMAKMGAFQKRFESVANKLGIDVQTGKNTNSKIRDTEYAAETANNLKSKIVQSAQVSVLGQAQVSQEAALRLIK